MAGVMAELRNVRKNTDVGGVLPVGGLFEESAIFIFSFVGGASNIGVDSEPICRPFAEIDFN